MMAERTTPRRAPDTGTILPSMGEWPRTSTSVFVEQARQAWQGTLNQSRHLVRCDDRERTLDGMQTGAYVTVWRLLCYMYRCYLRLETFVPWSS